MTDERCKQFMESLGRGNSQSLMVALMQVANETAQECKASLCCADTREKLAHLCHDQWSGWMEYLFSKTEGVTKGGSVILPAWAVTKWMRQMDTHYSELSEQEKESDRKEADRFLSIIQKEI